MKAMRKKMYCENKDRMCGGFYFVNLTCLCGGGGSQEFGIILHAIILYLVFIHQTLNRSWGPVNQNLLKRPTWHDGRF